MNDPGDFFEDLARSVKVQFEERKQRTIRVEILNKDGQLLSIGLAIFETDWLRGTFLPQPEILSGNPLANAAKLKMVAQQGIFELEDFRPCPCALFGVHFDFRLKS